MAEFAHAMSEHPLATHATGEVSGAVLEELGPGLDLAVLFVAGDHAGAIEDIAFTLRELLRPAVMVGTTAVSVVGGGREVEGRAAISLLAGRGVEAEAVRLRAHREGDGVQVVGWDGDRVEGSSGFLLLADPFSFPVDPFLGHVAEAHPGFPVIGGLASAADGPGGNRLVVDGTVLDSGAVGVLLGPGTEVATVVSQGCRPIGEAFTVTRSTRNVIEELGGEPPLRRLEDLAATLSPDDQQLLRQGLHLGLVVEQNRAEFQRGDFLVRNVLGADRQSGAMATDQAVEVGTVVQFHVRDAASAHDDLRSLMSGRRAEGALLFTCNGRGTHLFDEPDHDARLVSDSLAEAPLAGMFCAGEVGPIGDRSYLHGFTASVLLFR